MNQSISSPTQLNSPRLRVVRDEDAPPYDGESPAPHRESGHVTMIVDSVVDEVAARCGMAASGLYMVLERRVNKEGEWVTTNAQLAAGFGQTERHVRDTANALEAAGFIRRESVLGPTGMTIGIRYILPKHMRTYRAEPTPEPGAEPTPEPSRATVKEISSYQVVTSKAPKKSRDSAPDTPVPEDLLDLIPGDTWQAMKAETRLTDEQLRFETSLMIDRNLRKGGTSKNWVASWRSWMRSPYRQSQPAPSSNGAWVPSHV